MMKPKQQVKPQPRHFFLWRRSNIYDETALDALSIMHHISPVAYARLSCLAEKFQAIFGSVYRPPTSEKVSPLFEFLVLRLVCFDYISSDFRKTDSLTSITDELLKGYNRIKDATKILRISEVTARIHAAFHGDSKTSNTSNEEHISKMDPKKTNRVSRLKEAEAYEQMQLTSFLQKYLGVENGKLDKWEGGDADRLAQRHQAEWQFEQVRRLELLSMPQQYLRWQDFEKLHKKSFGCTFLEDKRTRPYVYSLKLNRPSTESEPVLMRLEEMVQLRSSVDYEPESALFVKDMLEQLKKYHIETSNFQDKQKHYYAHLSPHNLLFDQITLRPKLSYEPLLQELLGLRKRPLSLETMIAFCTPKEFDYFQGERELEPEVRLRLGDPMHGAQNLYVRKAQGDAVAKEGRELLRLEESNCIDRFLLTSHYLLNGKKFGRPDNPTSYKHIEQHFLGALRAEKAALREGRKELKEWLGPAAAGVKGKVELGFWELVEALTEEEKDSVMEGQRFTRIIRYLNLRYTLVREVVAVLTNQRLFHKLSNAKKYIILFLTFGVQYLEEVRLVCVEGTRGANVGVLRRYIDENGKKLRSGYTVGSSLESTYNKIEEYRQRANKDQNRFLAEEEGIRLMEACNKLNIATIQERRKLDEVCIMVKEGSKQSKDRAKEEITAMWGRTGKVLEESGKMLADFVKVETKLKYANGPHRLPESPTADVAELYLQTTRRFQLTIRALLSSTPENYLVYDTLVGRLLHLDNAEHFKQLSEAAPPALQKLLKVERSALDHADDMLGLSGKRGVGVVGRKQDRKEDVMQSEDYKV